MLSTTFGVRHDQVQKLTVTLKNRFQRNRQHESHSTSLCDRWQDAVGRAGALFGVGPLPELPNPLEWFSETPDNPRTPSSAVQPPPNPVSVPWSLPIFSEEERRQAEGGRSESARSGELSPEEKRGIIEAELARAEVSLPEQQRRPSLAGAIRRQFLRRMKSAPVSSLSSPPHVHIILPPAAS